MFCVKYAIWLVCLNELCSFFLFLIFLFFSFLAPRYFFTYLLPHQAPPGLTHLVDRIMNSTGEHSGGGGGGGEREIERERGREREGEKERKRREMERERKRGRREMEGEGE